jgi:hypothetical protein
VDVTDAAYFRAKASHRRELVAAATDLETQAALVVLADDFLQRALAADEAERDGTDSAKQAG